MVDLHSLSWYHADTMPSVNRILLDLQSLDDDLRAGRARLAALRRELGDDTTLQEARAALAASQELLADADRQIVAGEARIESLNTIIAKLEKRLFDGSIHNAREADSAQEEIVRRRDDHGATEDAVLAAMERADAARGALAAAQTRLADAERERAECVATTKAAGRALTARAGAWQERRTLLAAAVPPAIVARYERLRAGHAPGVVAIHDGACGGCGVAVPTSMRQRVAADEQVQCPNCMRLLAES